MPARYPYRTRAVVIGCVALLGFATSVALGLIWTAAGQLVLLAGAVSQFWQPENPDAERPSTRRNMPIYAVLVFAGMALGFSGGGAALLDSLEPLAIPSGVATLAAVIVFSVIPQIRSERQMRSG